MGKSGKAGGGVEIPIYKISLHLGLCLSGEDMELIALKMGDAEMWRGSATDQTSFNIDKPDLFGGGKREGGVRGKVDWLPGMRNQILPARLAERLGLTPETSPAYRGLASIWLTGDDQPFPGTTGNGGGFYVGNNPYLKPVSALVWRPSLGLNPSLAEIALPDDSEGNAQRAINPIHVIFECLTAAWAKAYPFSAIDIPSFEAAAQVVFDEGLGVSFLWNRQSTVEDLIAEILGHVQGSLYESPRTGQFTLTLYRGGYDINQLREITVDNAELGNFTRKAWGKIVNEVVGTWTNPETEKDETVTVQDLAAIAIQGKIESTSKPYRMFRSEAAALLAVQRDLASLSYPLAACEARVNRSFWDAYPGEVLKVTWPERGLAGVAMRIVEVPSRGSSSSDEIRLSLQEDIFGLDESVYVAPSETSWVNPAELAEDLTGTVAFTAPAFLAIKALGVSDASDLVYPSAVVVLLPIPNSTDLIGLELYGPETLPTGALRERSYGDFSFPGTGLLPSGGLPAEAESTLFGATSYRGQIPIVGDFITFGSTEANNEICLVQEVLSGGAGYRISRGMLDTVPKEWGTGARFWVLRSQFISDKVERVAGEDPTYKLLPRTSLGALPLADATGVTPTLSDRAHLPLRPASVEVDGVDFGTVSGALPNPLPVTWVNRNRTLEATQAFAWTEATVSPEAGQTTTIEVLNALGTVVTTINGITGVDHDLPLSAFEQNRAGAFAVQGSVRVRSKIGSDLSLQGHRIPVDGTFNSITISGVTGGLGKIDVTGSYDTDFPFVSFRAYRAAVGAGFGAAVQVGGDWPLATGSGTISMAVGDATRTNLLTNHDFSGGSTGWTLQTDWSVASGVGSKAAGAASRLIFQNPTLTAGQVVRFQFDITSISAGSFAFRSSGTTSSTGPLEATTGSKRGTVTVPASPNALGVVGTNAAAGSVDNLIGYVETVDCLPQGVADFFLRPVTAGGYEGAAIGPFTATVI